MYTLTAIEVLRAGGGDDLVAEVLAAAGEARSAADLEQDGTWSSYDQLRRLLEAASARLGGPEALGPTSPSDADMVIISTTATLQSLGSPNSMLSSLAASGSSPVSTVTTGRYLQQADTTWHVIGGLNEGFDPYPELCFLGLRLLTMVPRLFGFSDVTAREISCQCRGDDTCVAELHWEERDELHRRLDFVTTRAQVLEERLTRLHQTVAGIVSDENLDTVLNQIVGSAAAAVGAPGFVLTVQADPTAAPTVHSHGVDHATAEAVARTIRTDGDGRTRLAAEVRSSRRHYGWLAVVGHDESPFLEQERSILESYARLAATALDVATALDTSRRETATARALLQLAGSLAEVTSVDEMAARLARAVPEVIDCDRAVVVLVDPATSAARIAATVGYDEHLDRRLRSAALPVDDLLPSPSGLEYGDSHSEAEHPWVRDLMSSTGSITRASVPIAADGQILGHVVVTVTERPERLREDLYLAERLQGLAAQAATALRNASLHDQIRHQAMHDGLTGLPNRALVLDRAQQMLARCRRAGRCAAVMFVDLDGFKDINDTLGHAAGDRVLQLVAERLTTTVRGTDTIGRLGGDEFVVLVEGDGADPNPEVLAERILKVIEEPLAIGDGSVSVAITGSIGISVGIPDNADELLREADIALYGAKATGKNRHVVFRPEMQAEILNRHLLFSDLRSGVAESCTRSCSRARHWA